MVVSNQKPRHGGLPCYSMLIASVGPSDSYTTDTLSSNPGGACLGPLVPWCGKYDMSRLDAVPDPATRVSEVMR